MLKGESVCRDAVIHSPPQALIDAVISINNLLADGFLFLSSLFSVVNTS